MEPVVVKGFEGEIEGGVWVQLVIAAVVPHGALVILEGRRDAIKVAGGRCFHKWVRGWVPLSPAFVEAHLEARGTNDAKLQVLREFSDP